MSNKDMAEVLLEIAALFDGTASICGHKFAAVARDRASKLEPPKPANKYYIGTDDRVRLVDDPSKKVSTEEIERLLNTHPESLA